ncbi:MAG: FAD-binding oxidoreductase [Nibricoccus sp.]
MKPPGTSADPLLVNDLHSALNSTRVARIVSPRGLNEIVALIHEAIAANAAISVCGGRHAMGGQQFGTDTWLVDLSHHSAVLSFDTERGLITAEAGIQWPEIIAACAAHHRSGQTAWSIRQKQTGADRLSLGGALSANIHGRGLRYPPVVSDVEAFTLVDANGDVRRCNRIENTDLFRLAIGGYGLFGIIADVTLRLIPRTKVERRVEVLTLDALIRVPEERDTTQWLFGDFQYSIDENSPDFLQLGVFSAYHRIADDQPVPEEQKQLRASDWERLIHLAHTDRARVFQEYSRYYLSTDRQRYWSDTHQLSTYLDHYHVAQDERSGHAHSHRASEMISELYVPRGALSTFMKRAADLLRPSGIPVIYGTIRLIERDTETFLAWAREPWACVIFNLHVDHTPDGIARASAMFRALIDTALDLGGSYFLTYHRWARRDQVERAYPQFRDFLRLKDVHDPRHRFQSDWWRHHRELFAIP